MAAASSVSSHSIKRAPSQDARGAPARGQNGEVARVVQTSLASQSPPTQLPADLLSECCKKGDIAVVRRAIERGARPDAQTLTWACHSKKYEIVEAVVAVGAKPDGETLTTACATGNPAIVMKILSLGATPSFNTKRIAEKSRNDEIIRMIYTLRSESSPWSSTSEDPFKPNKEDLFKKQQETIRAIEQNTLDRQMEAHHWNLLGGYLLRGQTVNVRGKPYTQKDTALEAISLEYPGKFDAHLVLASILPDGEKILMPDGKWMTKKQLCKKAMAIDGGQPHTTAVL